MNELVVDEVLFVAAADWPMELLAVLAVDVVLAVVELVVASLSESADELVVGVLK